MGVRITGLDTPFGGVSWEYTETAKHGVQELFYFLETKRILTNPIEMEIKSWCASSAIEIKTKVAEILGRYDFMELVKVPALYSPFLPQCVFRRPSLQSKISGQDAQGDPRPGKQEGRP